MIEGHVEIAGYDLVIQDEQIMIYVPGGSGDSEPLTPAIVSRLAHLTGLAATHYDQMVTRRDRYPYPSLQEKVPNAATREDWLQEGDPSPVENSMFGSGRPAV
jgi:hypothetical protein